MKIDWQKRRWLAVLPLVALVVLVAVVTLKAPPARREGDPPAPLVEVMTVAARTMTPYAQGFGRVRAKESWQALAESSGRILYRHPKLEPGQVLKAGTLLLKIDPADYQLKLAQAEAELASARIELERIGQDRQKLALSLKLEQQRLAISRQELERKRGLAARGSLSKSALEQEEARLLTQQQQVLELDNALKLIPHELAVAEARIRVNESRLAEADRQLAKTELRLPFDARIDSVQAELAQYVSERETLLSAYRLGIMEIGVQVAMADMRRLADYLLQDGLPSGGGLPDVAALGLDAEALLSVGDRQYRWDGKLTGIAAGLDPNANTVVLMVELPDPLTDFTPGRRPPLVRDMYLQVRVKGTPRPLPAVPSQALHGDHLYLVDDQDRLVIRQVEPGFEQDGYTAILSGLAAGETVVLTDLLPAVPGMALRTREVAP
ncbi:biotin/lipoyl-binding protein [Gallaecimonas sp. GXIMD4217]|uniref:efflux RND transporter periplasmic adaptor subunit n=1 Tax=Gallaecimonas sp. GXIMD4217 TaxID=3131927 RepID=UPI00311B2B7B